jgi:MoaA/NifB/PqqE/SkfB family radical SAM enzyme
MSSPKPVILPKTCNYIAVFLTLGCNLKCSFCINRFGGHASYNSRNHLSGKEWVRALNRITSRRDLPITLQGGEPSLHKDFIYIINNIKPELTIDILTNLQFDVKEFIRLVKPERVKRDAPYASIRVSYHPEVMDLNPLMDKVLDMRDAGFSVGVWGVLHPLQEKAIKTAMDACAKKGIDFRTKEFLGFYKNSLYGTYKYPQACMGRPVKAVLCRSTELILGSDGGVYPCHGHLYEGRPPEGNILNNDFSYNEGFRPCGFYGACNPCDVKLKTDRFQVFGHTSVEIRPAPAE